MSELVTFVYIYAPDNIYGENLQDAHRQLVTDFIERLKVFIEAENNRYPIRCWALLQQEGCHMQGIMLIGYDVEARGAGDVTPQFLRQARALHSRLGVPATLFVVGQTLEQWVPEFQAIATDPLFDLQQHTYSHQLLKTVHIDDGKSVRVVRGVSLDETRQEVRKTK